MSAPGKDLELRGGGGLLGLQAVRATPITGSRPPNSSTCCRSAHGDARLFVERDGGMEGARAEDWSAPPAPTCSNAPRRCRLLRSG